MGFGTVGVCRFEMEVGSLVKSILAMFGAGTAKRYVTLHRNAVEIRMGWLASHSIPLNAIARVELTRWPLWAGLGPGRLGPNKTLGIVSSTRGTVLIAFREPFEFKLPFRLRRNGVVVALQDPNKFITEFDALIQMDRP